MKAKSVQKGEYIDYTTAAAVSAGDIIYVGKMPCVVDFDAKAGEKVAIHVSGGYDVVKDANAISLGAPVYWDGTNGKATATAKADFLGICVAAALAGDSTVRILLGKGSSEYVAPESSSGE